MSKGGLLHLHILVTPEFKNELMACAKEKNTQVSNLVRMWVTERLRIEQKAKNKNSSS